MLLAFSGTKPPVRNLRTNSHAQALKQHRQTARTSCATRQRLPPPPPFALNIRPCRALHVDLRVVQRSAGGCAGQYCVQLCV